eukprot:973364-Pyramimonas_sp.AAC.1
MIDSSSCSLIHHALLLATSWRHFVSKASHTSCWTCSGRLGSPYPALPHYIANSAPATILHCETWQQKERLAKCQLWAGLLAAESRKLS